MTADPASHISTFHRLRHTIEGLAVRQGNITATTLTLMLFFAVSADAATRYVATTGSDAAAGTLAAPVATIQRAVDLSVAGDTVVVLDGTYGPNRAYTCGTTCSQSGYAAPVKFSVSGTATAPITVKAANKWKAVLDCMLPYGYSGDGTDGVPACDAYFVFGNTASYIIIQDFDITGGYWKGVHMNGSNNHHISIRGNRFHDIGNRHYTIPSGGTSGGIVGVYAGTGTSNITFDGNVFTNIGRLPTAGQSSTDYNHDHGLYVYNGPYTVTNNVFYDNKAGWGIQLSPGTHDVSIANNTFSGANPYRDGHIVLWGNSSNITIQNNIFFAPRNYAIDTWEPVETNTWIDHNIVCCSGTGVISQVLFGSTVTNNVTGTDPSFVSAANKDFHLTSSSRAIDAGAFVASVSSDADGTPRPGGAGYDVGAYEVAVTTVTAPFDFGLQTATSSLNLQAGQSGRTSLTAQLASGSPQAVSFSVLGLPFGVSASWSATACSPSCSSDLLISAGPDTEAGTYALSVEASGGGLTRYQIITLNVTSAPSPTSTSGASSTDPSALWKLNEGSGTFAADMTGHGGTGYLQNVGWWTSGAIPAAAFNGNGWIEVGESQYLEATTNLTVAFWISPQDVPGIDERIIAKRNSWDVKLNGSNRRPQISSGQKYAAMSDSLAIGRWQHVAFTFSAGTVSGYLNGAPVGLNTSFRGGEVLPAAAAGLILGGDSNSASLMKGLLSDVYLFNRVLSDAEIRNLYTQSPH